jgi:cytoskeletal protein RodZ
MAKTTKGTPKKKAAAPKAKSAPKTERTNFTRKELRTPRSLGGRLNARRLELGLSLADVERQTKIQESYLVALEGDRHDELPPVYLRGLLRNYATYLGLSPDDLSAHFFKEQTVRENVKRARRTTMRARPRTPLPKVLITPRRLIITSLVVGIVVVFTYIYLQASTLTAPPKLSITQPASQQQSVAGDSLILVGQADPDDIVTINDTEVSTDNNGNFKELIGLQNGINQIRITAKDKLGKQTTVYRNVLAHISQATSTPPNTTGVQLQVRVGPRSTWLIVTADGTSVFNGVVLDGTTKIFRADNTISLSTGDAGSTQLTLTNQKVSAKDIGTVGADHQTRRSLKFGADTIGL